MIVHDLVTIGIPISEKVIRTVAVYAGLALLLRLAGKRDLGQFNSFDLVVVLLLSNLVQNAVIGADNSLVGGLLGAAVLVALNSAVVRAVRRGPRWERIFEGEASVLVSDGRPDDRALRRVGLRRVELEAAVRRQNGNDMSEADRVTLEPGGALVVTLRPEEQNATKGDLSALEERLSALLARP